MLTAMHFPLVGNWSISPKFLTMSLDSSRGLLGPQHSRAVTLRHESATNNNNSASSGMRRNVDGVGRADAKMGDILLWMLLMLLLLLFFLFFAVVSARGMDVPKATSSAVVVVVIFVVVVATIVIECFIFHSKAVIDQKRRSGMKTRWIFVIVPWHFK